MAEMDGSECSSKHEIRKRQRVESLSTERLQRAIRDISSNDTNLQLKATRQIREWISIENSGIEGFAEYLVPLIVEFQKSNHSLELKTEIACVLKDIGFHTWRSTDVAINHLLFPISHQDDDDQVHIPSLVVDILSDDKNLQLQAILRFERMLVDGMFQIDEVLETNVVGRFIELLERQDCAQLQPAAARILIRIISSTSWNIGVMIKHGLVNVLLDFLGHSDDNICEEAVKELRAVAHTCSGRDYLLEQGALPRLLAVFHKNPKDSILRKATKTLLNFCRGEPQPAFHKVEPALPYLHRLINSKDVEVLQNACLALFYLSDHKNGNAKAAFDKGVCPKLVELLKHQSHSVVSAALRTIRNIIEGDDIQIQDIVDHGFLPCLLHLLREGREVEEVCWIIEDIVAQNSERLKAVMDAKLLDPVIDLLQAEKFEIKLMAAAAISSAINSADDTQILSLVDSCMRPLCDLLVSDEIAIVTECLEGLEKILEAGEKNKVGGCNLYAQQIKEYGGLEKITAPMACYYSDVCHQAKKIYTTYWPSK